MTGAEEVRQGLSTLRDVEGVTGSFVYARNGRVLARELPPLFDDGALMEAGGRLARLQDTFATVGDELATAVLRFRDYRLFLKVLSAGTLCIVANNEVNMPAMRMAANLVGRRIGAVLQSSELAKEPAPEAPPAASPTPKPGPPMAPPGMRRFRGRPVD